MLTPIPLTPIVGRLALPRLKPLAGLNPAYERQWTLTPRDTPRNDDTVHFFTAVLRAVYTTYVIVPAVCRQAVETGTPPYRMLDFARAAHRQVVQPEPRAETPLSVPPANVMVADRRWLHASVISASALAVIGALVIFGELNDTYQTFIAAPHPQAQPQVHQQAGSIVAKRARDAKPAPTKPEADIAAAIETVTHRESQADDSLARAANPHPPAKRDTLRARARRAPTIAMLLPQRARPPVQTQREPDDLARLLAESTAPEAVPPRPVISRSSAAENRVAPLQHHRVTERPDLFQH
jgi:hypothetical protein